MQQSRTTDLAADARWSDTPTVFHLLGRVAASPDYVITEKEMLELFTAMQAEPKRPNVLPEELKTAHLLLIGNTFWDWLPHFFIRIAWSSSSPPPIPKKLP